MQVSTNGLKNYNKFQKIKLVGFSIMNTTHFHITIEVLLIFKKIIYKVLYKVLMRHFYNLLRFMVKIIVLSTI